MVWCVYCWYYAKLRPRRQKESDLGFEIPTPYRGRYCICNTSTWHYCSLHADRISSFYASDFCALFTLELLQLCLDGSEITCEIGLNALLKTYFGSGVGARPSNQWVASYGRGTAHKACLYAENHPCHIRFCDQKVWRMGPKEICVPINWWMIRTFEVPWICHWMHRDVCWYAVLSLLRYVDFSEGRNLKGVLNLKIITYLYFCFLLKCVWRGYH